MHVISVNVGQKREIAVGQREKTTGIFKTPVAHPVEVSLSGVTGDQVVDKKHHGGPDQAVYLYRQEDYQCWSDELGEPLSPGTFGENITIAGLSSAAMNIGDRLKSHRLELEITAPRIPCSIFAARMGDPGFVKAFLQAERPGFYARVIGPGLVGAGDEFELVETNLDSISTVQLYRDMQKQLSAEQLRRYLLLPISVRVREDFAKQLKRLAG
ncbi:MAG: MOSC domain-containing protein [Pseudomonadales bacterium]